MFPRPGGTVKLPALRSRDSASFSPQPPAAATPERSRTSSCREPSAGARPAQHFGGPTMTLAFASRSFLVLGLALGAAAAPASAAQRVPTPPFAGAAIVAPSFQSSWLALGSPAHSAPV